MPSSLFYNILCLTLNSWSVTQSALPLGKCYTILSLNIIIIIIIIIINDLFQFGL